MHPTPEGACQQTFDPAGSREAKIASLEGKRELLAIGQAEESGGIWAGGLHPNLVPEQVPAKSYSYDHRTPPGNVAVTGRPTGQVIQALKYLGQEHVTPERMAHLKRILLPAVRRSLIQDIKLAPIRMHRNLCELAED